MTGSLQEPARAGETAAAPRVEAAPETASVPDVLKIAADERRGRLNWPAAWLLMTCAAAMVSTGFVAAAGGKRGYFIPLIATMVCLAAGFSDSRTGRIPNRLTYPAILLGLGLNGLIPLLRWLQNAGFEAASHDGTLVTWLGGPGAAASVEGFGVCFLIGLLGALFGGVHGGDLKLMAALGALLGLWGVVNVIIISIGLALIYALINLAVQGRLVGALRLGINRMMEWHFLRQFNTPLADAEPYDAMHFPMALPLAVGMILWQYWQWRTGEVLL